MNNRKNHIGIVLFTLIALFCMIGVFIIFLFLGWAYRWM